MEQYELLKRKIDYYDQGHLLTFYNELNATEKESLLEQISGINFEEIEKAYKQLSNRSFKQRSEITPIEYESISNLSDSERKMYEERGLQLLREKKVAVVLLAGGQGTRLGHDGPKGTISFSDSTKQSLFALQAERLRKIEKKTDSIVPWYIMTSPINDKETRDYFRNNNYFNCNPNQIFFFKQDLIPTITPKGKLILESKSKISMAPNGNGGVFTSMKSNGVLRELAEKGIKWVFFNNIDNALVQVADPLFIGFADKKGSRVASKAVKKREPGEKVGIFCLSEGRPSVIEYSEMSEEECEDENFFNSNIGIHLFSLSFLKDTVNINLPYHFAHKIIPTINENGKTIKSNAPNGYKLEKFYFDIFKYAESMSVLQVLREKEFAPVKNRSGEDSLESARKMLF
ncbi:UTP--glucose-1-phosphate uridylyltransferase [Fictibacillus nanhaiensis]|uniref:UTP--glucose-1-phosphate uridylyltransferase n=1 Tax=Fictibacillus nanhaiensis TaxID=742169 RepID=A0ABS2ZME5_9BACL|nr:UTP--glucose-1-phosphate uridylyltransferase [Fictibacillus nanhaiensis]